MIIDVILMCVMRTFSSYILNFHLSNVELFLLIVSQCLGLGEGRILQTRTVLRVNMCDTSLSLVLLQQHLLYLWDIPPVL